jgi:hypothetical protein
LDLESDPKRFRWHKKQGHCSGGDPKWGVLHFEGFSNGGLEFSTRRKTARALNNVVKRQPYKTPLHC